MLMVKIEFVLWKVGLPFNYRLKLESITFVLAANVCTNGTHFNDLDKYDLNANNWKKNIQPK